MWQVLAVKGTASFESSDFEGYIVLDTQMIVGGKHSRYRFTIDDYCFDRASVPSFGSDFCFAWEIMGTCQAAIAIYLDIVNLFLFLLQLFGERRR